MTIVNNFAVTCPCKNYAGWLFLCPYRNVGFPDYNLHRATNSPQSRNKIRLAFHFVERNKKNITRRLEDMNFISRGKNNILRTSAIFYSLAALVRKILFCHSKIKFISSRHRVISSIYVRAPYNLRLTFAFRDIASQEVRQQITFSDVICIL